MGAPRYNAKSLKHKEDHFILPEEILVDEVAAQAGTISYEILTGLTPRLRRAERG